MRKPVASQSLAAAPSDAPPRYVVGIDLGTTNSAACFVDTEETPWRVRVFPIAQVTAPGHVERLEVLPSCHYEPTPAETTGGALRPPWPAEPDVGVVGVYARERGGRVSGRLITSAKSWLCHGGVDRTADLLPWHAAPDARRVSPVTASARYLAHIRQAWDHEHPRAPLAQQDVVVTLPASFDEVARELTVAAAAQAGLPRVVLIEEPQAAFYAWVCLHAHDWERQVAPGQKILVCDIGGGTTDFTLIRVRGGPEGAVRFHRVAVGEHLILGGDNLDLALAHYAERKLKGEGKLDPRQFDILTRVCRAAKENLLTEDGADPGPEHVTLNIPGVGARVIGGGLQVEITRDELRQVLVEGFLPRVALTDKPQTRRSGFQEFGLPFAADAAITRYLAAFLTAHRHAGDELDAAASPESSKPEQGKPAQSQPDPRQPDPARPDIVLFNGGFFASALLRQRLLDVLCSWFPSPTGPPWRPRVLDNDRLDLAVARGAAYYGMVRRGQGVRIVASLARSYYIGVESQPPVALCLLPGNTEPGQEVTLSAPRFRLRVSQPVEFPLYVSSTRLTDPAGAVTPVDTEQVTALPPMRTVLRASRKSETGEVDVTLHAKLTEIGTIELWCAQVDQDRAWRLQFDVRSATQTDLAAHESAAESEGVLDEDCWRLCRERIGQVFSATGAAAPDQLVKQLVEAAQMERQEWPTSLLRRIWEELMAAQEGRARSAVHEARWLNLLGYALRPGFGYAVDDWRVAETWKAVQGKLAHSAASCRVESWIVWRRVAGGLTGGQQQALAEPLLSTARALHRAALGKGRGESHLTAAESTEMWRLLGALELLPGGWKLELGRVLVELLPLRKLAPARAALVWALGRLGARTLVHGPLNLVVPVEVAGPWLEQLLDCAADDAADKLAVMQLARRTGDRFRDVSEGLRDRAAAWLGQTNAPAHLVELVRHGGELDRDEQGKVFGEALPKGLRIL